MEVLEGTVDVGDVDAFVADLDQIGGAHGVAIQAFDARYVAGREHLGRAVALANRAWDRGDAIARDRAVEILLYAAGRRQIDRALAMGVSEGEGPVAVVVDGDGPDADEAGALAALRSLLSENPTLEDVDEAVVREFFDVSASELAATAGTLEDLVCERVALLAVEK